MNINAMDKDTYGLIEAHIPGKSGISNALIVSNVPMEMCEKIISKLTDSDFYIEETNGHDLDWSADITINGKSYEVWGSGRSGSLCFQLK